MRRKSIVLVITVLLMAVAFASGVAQESSSAEKEVLTGCLNPAGADGSFQLTVLEDGKAAKKILVTGSAEELAKHAKNHTVKVTGAMAKEHGKDVFKVSSVEHVDATCSASTE